MILGSEPYPDDNPLRSRDYHLIVFEHPRLARTERPRRLRAARVVLASDTTLPAAGPDAPFELCFLRLLRRALPHLPAGPATALAELNQRIGALTAKGYEFEYRDPLTRDLLGKFLPPLVRLLKGKLLNLTITDLANLDTFSCLLIRRIIEEERGFRHLFIFDFTRPRPRTAAARARVEPWARALFQILEICVMLKMWNRAHVIAEALLGLGKLLTDPRLLGLVQFRAGMVYARKGLLDRSIASYRAAQAVFERTEDHANLIKALSNLGNVYTDLGRYAEAQQLFQRALGLSEERQNDYSLAVVYSSLGNVDIRLGHYAAAYDELQKALVFTLRSGYFSRVQITYCYLGDVSYAVKEKARALRFYRAAARFATLENIRIDLAMIRMRLGSFWLNEKAFGRCRAEFRAAESIYRSYNNQYGLMLVAEQYGNLARAMRQYPAARQQYRAARLLAKRFGKAELAAELDEKIRTVEFYCRGAAR